MLSEKEVNISKSVFGDSYFDLPIEWDGVDFSKEIRNRQNEYLNRIDEYSSDLYNSILTIQNYIISSIENYFQGLPAIAFTKIDEMMKEYMKCFIISSSIDAVYYRVCKVEKNETINRKRMFHPPYSKRYLIGTERYSIAGYPCLYLSDKLQLCASEVGYEKTYDCDYIAARFVSKKTDDICARFLDLSIKPQDIIHERYDIMPYTFDLNRYLSTYPMIMASSFVRKYRNGRFACEYIIPQLILQWLHKYMMIQDYGSIIGVKYFSCRSKENSYIGYNYAFPSYIQIGNNDYCSVLDKGFRLSEPVRMSDFNTFEECQDYLDSLQEYKRVMD